MPDGRSYPSWMSDRASRNRANSRSGQQRPGTSSYPMWLQLRIQRAKEASAKASAMKAAGTGQAAGPKNQAPAPRTSPPMPGGSFRYPSEAEMAARWVGQNFKASDVMQYGAPLPWNEVAVRGVQNYVQNKSDAYRYGLFGSTPQAAETSAAVGSGLYYDDMGRLVDPDIIAEKHLNRIMDAIDRRMASQQTAAAQETPLTDYGYGGGGYGYNYGYPSSEYVAPSPDIPKWLYGVVTWRGH